MNLDKLEQLMIEYLSTLQNTEDIEWYTTDRDVAFMILLEDLPCSKWVSFRTFLEEKETDVS